ncbi:MAG: GNAT family N-acetyltransferase [Clostridia bacterium]|nr:GNAT family N-acetyltransferase [Clostridia bacterium]
MYTGFTSAQAKLIVPQLQDLWFRRQLLADPDTMSYNRVCGGTIDFPEEKWADWYARWVLDTEGKHFYSYVVNQAGAFVGEAAYHWDASRCICCADVIVAAQYRRRGYGRAALIMLCGAAKQNGISVLHDDIAVGNPAVKLFLALGFLEEYRTDEYIMLKKKLRD